MATKVIEVPINQLQQTLKEALIALDVTYQYLVLPVNLNPDEKTSLEKMLGLDTDHSARQFSETDNAYITTCPTRQPDVYYQIVEGLDGKVIGKTVEIYSPKSAAANVLHSQFHH